MAVIANIKEYFNKTTPRRKFGWKDAGPARIPGFGETYTPSESAQTLKFVFLCAQKKEPGK
ncbi:hypothetical protein DLD77_04660 [Chitinophaga alhagiae]|uniref:Uncharacterized protein n=1 Tax=Chitinophaga alhagiae TaxID=2203219 RepID=A0ABN5LNQ8_9BACT|nr:hypothetical protein DLD77_04660 [Chitinophaga alhagiae]